MKKRDILIILGLVAVATTTAITVVSVNKLTDQTITVEDTTEEKPLGGAIANDIDLTQSAPEVEKEEEIEVFYAQCGTEADKLTIKNGEPVDYKIKDYVPVVYLEYMQELDYDYTYDAEKGEVYSKDRLVSDNVEKTEDGKLLVKDYQMQNGKPILKYVRTAPNEVEARYIGVASLDSPINSGITFVLEEDASNEGVYKLKGMRGIFNEDLTDAKLPLYEGKFIGWSLYKDELPCFNVDDEVKISNGMRLLPYFEDNAACQKATETGECVADSPEEIDGKAVLRIIKTEDGKYVLADFDADEDTVKTPDGKEIPKEEIEPTEPKEPTDPKEPKDPKQPTEPKEPKQPKEPTEPKQPAQPTQPTEPQQPAVDPDTGDGWFDAGPDCVTCDSNLGLEQYYEPGHEDWNWE